MEKFSVPSAPLEFNICAEESALLYYIFYSECPSWEITLAIILSNVLIAAISIDIFFLLYITQHYGYTWLIANNTHLSLELVLNEDNKVHDGLYIQKNN